MASGRPKLEIDAASARNILNRTGGKRGIDSVENKAVSIKMRSGQELILATKRFAQDAPLRSWWCIVSTSLLLVAALAGTIADFHPAARAACSVLAGLLILRLFVIYHDQQHHAILPKSRLAEGLMRVFGILALSASSIWRSSHNHHHNHNSKLRGSQIGSGAFRI